jgi:Zn-dependent M32 family carboxypeptidase
MLQETWQIVLFGVATAFVGGIGTFVTNIIARLIKSKHEKKSDESNARIVNVQADSAQLGLFKEEFDTLKEHKSWAISEFDRLEKLLRLEKEESNKRYALYEGEIEKLKKAYSTAIKAAEEERIKKDFFKSLLKSLIELVLVTCPRSVDVEPYLEAIQNDNEL